jgi:hypothetical protein
MQLRARLCKLEGILSHQRTTPSAKLPQKQISGQTARWNEMVHTVTVASTPPATAPDSKETPGEMICFVFFCVDSVEVVGAPLLCAAGTAI